jgi:hypothetical protein
MLFESSLFYFLVKRAITDASYEGDGVSPKLSSGSEPDPVCEDNPGALSRCCTKGDARSLPRVDPEDDPLLVDL